MRLNGHNEHAEQCALISWWDWQARARGVEPDLLFAIPNGGKRNAVTGARLKAEGARRGVPDLFLAYPKNGFGGLFLELKKSKGGKTSPEQKAMLERLANAGYAACVCHGFQEAKNHICVYLGWKLPPERPARAKKPGAAMPWDNWGDMNED